ncbi:hypothetical protein CAEBREN_22377 [Caenorhabditis brenneri]|uniref:Thioredoxin domain-containing protein 17 n=1 Tax=Caenorhabditis brenneri TaxID=135651 RepID=G0N644_CAEBE|nr:hypothetical protein CAEBREN_22377 [Caenorhabditis brenneri]
MSLKHYTAQGYEAFQETLKSIGKGQRVVALFTGSKSLTTGESWCSRCAIAELVIDEVIKGADVAGIDVHFVTVFVGNREVWRDPSVGFRTDPALKLSCIPTLLEIGNKSKRLTPPDIYQAQRVKYYFTEE